MTTRFREYRLATRVYVGLVVAAGALSISWAIHDTWVNPTIDLGWLVLAGLTLASSSITLKVPSFPAVLTVSETFVFTAVLLYGPSAGTLTVALDALAIGFWTTLQRNPIHKSVFTLCANTLAMFLGTLGFSATSTTGPLIYSRVSQEVISELLLPLLVLASVYFSVSSLLFAFAIAAETKAGPFKIWRSNFAWLSLNYFAGASVAVLFVAYTPLRDPRYLLVIVPLIVVLYLAFVTSIGRIEDANKHLEELNLLHLSTIETLAMAIDAKDQITHGHIRRVQQYAVGLARTLGVQDRKEIRAIEAASLLHDMGKLAVPDYILNKPGALTPAEFDRMKLHSSVGADILSSIKFPYPVVPIVRHHHENWDGTGYPDGLRGEDIPIGARILSVVDCFDALTSDRPYRPRLSDEAALEILRARRGSMYDPLVVDKFRDIWHRLAAAESQKAIRPESLAAIAQASAEGSEPRADTRLDQIAASSEEMMTWYELARAVNGPLSFDEAAEIVARYIRRMIPSAYCVFYTYDPKKDDLKVGHASGDSSGIFTGLRIGMGQRLTGWVAANRQTIVNSDPVLDLGESARALQPPLRSCLSTPLLCDNALVGVVTLYSNSKNAFNEDHRRIIEAGAHQISGTLRNALHFVSRERTSLRDDLSGLPSIERLPYIADNLDSVDAEGSSLILAGVDRIREVARTYGRIRAVEVLGQVAATIDDQLQSGELLFRTGQDEFVVYLPKTSKDRPDRRALSLRAAVRQAGIGGPVEGGVISISVAVASVPSDGGSVDAALAAASQRLAGQRPPSDRSSVH